MSTLNVQAILNAISHPAIILDKEYRILLANDQYRSRYGFSDQSKQRLCYEVSHHNSVPCDLAGETCPLREALNTGQPTQVLHIHHTPNGQEYVNVEMWPIKDPHSGEVSFFLEQMHPTTSGSVSHSDSNTALVGKSPAFVQMLGLIERVAPSNANVMLLGETGTGKEIVAQTIHRHSERRDAPFVPVECAGLPDTLFESELFGFLKGTFTGAHADKPGLVAAAEGGTLFLDEVGEIPLPDQVKLLRLLETRRYRQIGSNNWAEADFRLICATNRDLQEMVKAGTFREDLFYRLNVFEIELPPLRERQEDLELLTQSLLLRIQHPELRLSPAAQACLQAYSFPGNIRELRNIVERAALMADNGVIEINHLPAHCQKALSSPPPRAINTQLLTDHIEPLETIEQRYLTHAVRIHQGSRKALAEQLGLSERALYRKLSRLRDHPNGAQ